MNKEQASERLITLEKELITLEKEVAELRKIIEAPEKISAKQWLISFLNENSKKFRVELADDQIAYYLGDQWIFNLDLKNKRFWYYYHKVGSIFQDDYNMEYEQIQQLVKDVLLKPLNCEGFTPRKMLASWRGKLLKPFNCEGFTPPRFPEDRTAGC